MRGRLAVGLIPTVAAVGIAGALRAFRERCPQVRITLRVGASEVLADQAARGELDVAFLGLPTTAPRPSGVNAREGARQPAGRRGVRGPARNTAGRTQYDEAFAAAGLSRDVAFEVTEFMARLVREEVGIALFASAYVPHLAGVAVVEIVGAPARVECVVRKRDSTPAALAFLDLLGVTPAAPGT